MASNVVVEEGSFELKVTDFSEKKQSVRTGDFLSYGLFEIGGHFWKLDFYPNGFVKPEDGRKRVAFYVMLVNTRSSVPHHKAKAEIIFNICDQSNNQSNGLIRRFTQTFSRRKALFGIGNFCFTSDLEDPKRRCLIKDDTLLIRCTIRVFKSPGNRRRHPWYRRCLGGLRYMCYRCYDFTGLNEIYNPTPLGYPGRRSIHEEFVRPKRKGAVV